MPGLNCANGPARLAHTNDQVPQIPNAPDFVTDGSQGRRAGNALLITTVVTVKLRSSRLHAWAHASVDWRNAGLKMLRHEPTGHAIDHDHPQFRLASKHGANMDRKLPQKHHWAFATKSRMPRSDGVRRQGLEPRTRRLRVCCSAN
jgi:hypothetical protein